VLLVSWPERTRCDIAMEFSRCTGLTPTFWKAATSAVSQNSTAWRLYRGRRDSRLSRVIGRYRSEDRSHQRARRLRS